MGFSSPKQCINQISCKSVMVELNALGDQRWNDPNRIDFESQVIQLAILLLSAE